MSMDASRVKTSKSDLSNAKRVEALINETNEKGSQLKEQLKRKKAHLEQLKRTRSRIGKEILEVNPALTKKETEKTKLQVKFNEGSSKLAELNQTTANLKSELEKKHEKQKNLKNQDAFWQTRHDERLNKVTNEMLRVHDEYKYNVLKTQVSSWENSIADIKTKMSEQNRSAEQIRIDIEASKNPVAKENAFVYTEEAKFAHKYFCDSISKLEDIKRKDTEVNLQLQIRLQDVKNRKKL